MTDYTHGNGLQTFYTYDDKGRLSTISHQDGAAVLESFDYDVDDTVNITKVMHADGSYWDYGYDGRYRLTSASRKSASGNIAANFAYVYDNADNLLTKVEPFAENFDDGNYSGWSTSGTLSAADGYIENTGAAAFWRSVSGGDGEIYFSYALQGEAMDGSDRAQCNFRLNAGASGAQVFVRFYPWRAEMYARTSSAGTWQFLDADEAVDSSAETQYDVRIAFDGDDVTVWRAERGVSVYEKVLDTDACPVGTGGDSVVFHMAGGSTHYDDIQLWIAGVSNTTTFECNAANELTKVYDPYGGETTFTYDGFGRMVTKALEENDTDTFSAVYTYGYGSMLTNVDTDIPGESDVAS